MIHNQALNSIQPYHQIQKKYHFNRQGSIYIYIFSLAFDRRKTNGDRKKNYNYIYNYSRIEPQSDDEINKEDNQGQLLDQEKSSNMNSNSFR